MAYKNSCKYEDFVGGKRRFSVFSVDQTWRQGSLPLKWLRKIHKVVMVVQD